MPERPGILFIGRLRPRRACPGRKARRGSRRDGRSHCARLKEGLARGAGRSERGRATLRWVNDADGRARPVIRTARARAEGESGLCDGPGHRVLAVPRWGVGGGPDAGRGDLGRGARVGPHAGNGKRAAGKESRSGLGGLLAGFGFRFFFLFSFSYFKPN